MSKDRPDNRARVKTGNKDDATSDRLSRPAPPDSPYQPKPRETLVEYLERVPGPVRLVAILDRDPMKEN